MDDTYQKQVEDNARRERERARMHQHLIMRKAATAIWDRWDSKRIEIGKPWDLCARIERMSMLSWPYAEQVSINVWHGEDLSFEEFEANVRISMVSSPQTGFSVQATLIRGDVNHSAVDVERHWKANPQSREATIATAAEGAIMVEKWLIALADKLRAEREEPLEVSGAF